MGVSPELDAFVVEALLKRNARYDELKSLLLDCRKRVAQEPDSEEASAELVTLIETITANTSAIQERVHEFVVSNILGIKLWKVAPAVLTAVLEFTRNLIITNTAFTHTCLKVIIYSFTPPPDALPEETCRDPNGPWRPSEKALAVQQALLSALTRILGLVPTAPTNMVPIIVGQIPHKLRDRNTQCLYLSALFGLAEDRAGAPIKEVLLTAVIEHLLSMDVEIKWEDIVDIPTGEEEEEQDDAANEDVFELEEMLASELDINAGPDELAKRHAMLALRQGAAGDGRGGWEGAVVGTHCHQRLQQTTPTPPAVDEMANKMDSLMELAFEHLRKRIAAGELRQLWETLLSSFERTILNTHRSKFTQFLLFYVCFQSPMYCSQSLVRLLLTRLRDVRQAPITRTACAAYLASFLARAAFAADALVVKALQDMATFCVDYSKSQGGGLTATQSTENLSAAARPQRAFSSSGLVVLALASEANAQMQRHQVFYAAIQAILYVLCYHMKSLVGDPLQQQQQVVADAGEQVRSNKERRELAETVVSLVRGPILQLLNHRLQPLGVCLPSVAAEFVHQAASLNIVDCRSLLAQVELSTRFQRPLEMFFPFDPYLLRRSSRYLQLKHSYVRWRHGHAQAAGGAAGTEAADSEDDEEEDIEGRDSEGKSAEEESASHSERDDDEDVDSDDEDMAGRSLPSDAMLHDPTHRLNPGAVLAARHHTRPHQRGHGSSVAMGTSYMSFASTETASQGAASPYGTSPHDAGGMLVQNPLGSSPGVVPMSLGTPEMHFMSQVPMRIGRQ
ncbi:hypothetical protein VaNZ11_013820 [Volvox africanus]|uniref:RNA polymerase I-specific transcription initiation factor RRN3 n=1 Tax=Volvox africanus TaxID=51714 RepID=A0ABQ5SIJ0_9CHLO|nr:hypothetical protein VaNZ11_013820 [Volvox africanus]